MSGYSGAKETLDGLMLVELRKQAEARGENADKVLLDDWRLHDLRRTVSTGMAALKVNGAKLSEVVIERCLNHVSGKLAGVAAVYNRWQYWDEKKEAWSAWANRLAEITTGHSAERKLTLVG